LGAALFGLALGAPAQPAALVDWSVTAEAAAVPPGGRLTARATARIQSGWHLYSASSPAGLPATFTLAPNRVVERLRVFQPRPARAFDANFGADTETFEGTVVFLLELQVAGDAPAGPAELAVNVRYQTCNDTKCVPARWSGTLPVRVDAAAPPSAAAIPTGYAEAVLPPPGRAPAPGTGPGIPAAQGIVAFLLVAFGFGLACLFTPCVFPMIPITVSYFLSRATGGKRDSLIQATVFCLGIVVLFSGLGLATTAILGPVGVKQLGSSPWVNGFITALFITFGLSLLGAFEITIPSSLLTRLNKGSEAGGFAGTLLMGLTFSLASFACVGPFVGTLLAASVGGGGVRPLAGMAAFAAGLALPFFLLALFPAWLKRLPRSGGWMARIKVVMGFVILAASLKYLASLDQVMGWGLVTRERFLAAWIVLFAMAGLYLLGFMRLEGVKPEDPLGLGRLLAAAALLAFALSLAPGMFGGKLGELDAYVPAAEAGGIASPGGGTAGAGLVWMKDQYRAALDRARAENKLVFIDFTGYACANCHWMRANMLARPEVAAELRKFVLVELFTDGTDAASEENSKLQLAKFNTVSLPFYAIVDPGENVTATFDGLTKDPKAFLGFLAQGNRPTAAPSVAAAAAPSGLPPLTSVDGTPFSQAPLTGKVVVVNFWATWCVPCIQEIPGFNRLHREFAARGVTVIGVSMDEEGAARVKPFLAKHPMEYPVALGSAAVSEKYRLDQLPVTLVLDRSGKQVKRFEGFTSESELRAALERVL
jgi:thiol:disulfide interchange protein DsbD